MAITKAFRVITVWCLLALPFSSQSFTVKYDHYIRKYSDAYLKPYVQIYGKEFFKAQLYQESLLNPNSVSQVGAAGIGQFMPDTWQEVSKKLNFPAQISVFDAKHNVWASAFYLSTLLNQWTTPRPVSDRLSLGWASYNAGLRNILDAQRQCEMAAAYKEIIACLPSVTGHHAKETTTYVQRIWSYYIQMRFL